MEKERKKERRTEQWRERERERERGRQKVGNSREEKTKKNGKCARLNVEKNFGNAFAV